MKFRTEIQIPPSDWHIHHSDRLLALGSCFAARIGKRLADAKFDISINPLGIAYHPLAISQHIHWITENRVPESIERDGIWHAFELHSSFNRLNKADFEENVQTEFANMSHAWVQANNVIVTFGTAWVYRRKDTAALVTNCHKYPAAFFEKELLTAEEIVAAWQHVMESFPQKRFLFTLSPIRHVKDSLSLNAVSKATLRLACHQLAQLPNGSYFPSYEIVMDDLRDYRFFESDLIHPNEMATDYIWEKFSKSLFSTTTQQLIHKWDKIQQSLAHRPFQPDSAAYQQFLQNLAAKLQDLSTILPVEKELQEVRLRLNL